MSGRVLLNRRMALETIQSVPDGAGGFIETPQVLGYIWVNIDAKLGRVSAEDGVTLTSVPLKVTARSAPINSPQRLRPGQVLVESTRRFRILSVAEAGDDGKYLTCVAREEEVPL